MRPSRAFFVMVATYRSGSSFDISVATRLANAFASSQVARVLIGATTCNPFPPVVLTKAPKPDACRRSRTSSTPATSPAHATPSPGSKSKTKAVGPLRVRGRGAPGRDLEDARLNQGEEAFPIADRDSLAGTTPHDVNMPVVDPGPAVLVVEARAHPVGAPDERGRPVGRMRQDIVRDLGVVLGEGTLRQTTSDHSTRPGWVSRTPPDDAFPTDFGCSPLPPARPRQAARRAELLQTKRAAVECRRSSRGTSLRRPAGDGPSWVAATSSTGRESSNPVTMPKRSPPRAGRTSDAPQRTRRPRMKAGARS